MSENRATAQDQVDLVQVDWDGNVLWRFDHLEHVSDPGAAPRWLARQHHDFQREGNHVGYFVPGQTPLTDRGNTLLLVHENVSSPAISPRRCSTTRSSRSTGKGASSVFGCSRMKRVFITTSLMIAPLNAPPKSVSPVTTACTLAGPLIVLPTKFRRIGARYPKSSASSTGVTVPLLP